MKTFPDLNCQKLVLDSNKSIIATGRLNGTVDLDAGPGVFNLTSTSNGTSFSDDIYIAKYDTSGQFRWATQIGGSSPDRASDVEVDNNGNIIILGIFQGTVDFDPGPGMQSLTTSPGASGFLLKLDHNGNFVWVRQVPYEMSQLNIDGAGNMIASGTFGGAQDFDPGPGTFTATAGYAYTDIAVLKLDSAANFVWMKQIKNTGTSQQQVSGLETAPDGSVYVGGYFTSSMDFDPGSGVTNLTSAGSRDAFVLKLNTQGDLEWVKQFEGAGTNGISGLAVDHSGNVFSTGGFVGSVDFDPGPANYTLTSSGTSRSCFISKLDRNGNFVYAKNMQSGDNFGQALAIDFSNNLYVSGGYHDADLDPGPGTYNVTGTGLFTIKLDVNGNLAWASPYMETASWYFESIYSTIQVDVLKNVYFSSVFTGTVDFDPDPAVHNVTAVATWDMCFHKLSQCGNTLNIINAGTCNTYSLNGITYKSPGTYYQTLTNSIGCDSIIQLNLTRPQVFTPINITVCDSYTWNGRLLTASGIYRDTFPAATACDSIVQLSLTITKTTVNTTDSACGSYAWGGMLLTNTGSYSHTFKTAKGCDSLVNLSLLIKTKPAPFLGNDTILCKGETITLSPGAFSTYKWNDNTAINTLTVSDTGTYWVLVAGSNGCTAKDSIHIKQSDYCNCSLDGRIKIYPSPFQNVLTIDKTPTSCKVRMNLYNMLGQLLLKDILIQDGLNKIPTGNLAAGIYFIKFHSDGKILLTKKISKQ